MDIGNADPGMNAGPSGFSQRLPASLNVGRHRAGQRADHRPFDFLREQLHGLKVFRRRRRISGFDDVHFQPRQLPCDHELLPAAQPRASGLLTIAQSSVEYSDLVEHGYSHSL